MYAPKSDHNIFLSATCVFWRWGKCTEIRINFFYLLRPDTLQGFDGVHRCGISPPVGLNVLKCDMHLVVHKRVLAVVLTKRVLAVVLAGGIR